MKQQSIILSQQDISNIEAIWNTYHKKARFLTKQSSGTINTSEVIRFALEKLALANKKGIS